MIVVAFLHISECRLSILWKSQFYCFGHRKFLLIFKIISISSVLFIEIREEKFKISHVLEYPRHLLFRVEKSDLTPKKLMPEAFAAAVSLFIIRLYKYYGFL